MANDMTHARTYTPLTSPRSFMDAAAQRAAADLARDGKTSRDTSDVARWEDEGGASKTLMPQRELASSIEERARLRMASRKAPAHLRQTAGRRTMGRHSNRP